MRESLQSGLFARFVDNEERFARLLRRVAEIVDRVHHPTADTSVLVEFDFDSLPCAFQVVCHRVAEPPTLLVLIDVAPPCRDQRGDDPVKGCEQVGPGASLPNAYGAHKSLASGFLKIHNAAPPRVLNERVTVLQLSDGYC